MWVNLGVWVVFPSSPLLPRGGQARQIQPCTSGVRLSTGYHKAFTPAGVEHLGMVHEVAMLMVHFLNIGGAQCTR